MLDMAACCRLTRSEGRNRGSRLEHGALAAVEGHTWCSGQGKWLRRSAGWLHFLGSFRPTHVAPSFFRSRPFRQEMESEDMDADFEVNINLCEEGGMCV